MATTFQGILAATLFTLKSINELQMTNQWVSVSYSCTMTLPDECRSMPSVHHVVPDVCYVMLCLSRDVEKAGKRWRWPALGSGWSELASNYQCSRSKFLPELRIALCRRWSCKKETDGVHSTVVLCANRKFVCLVLLCEKQLCTEYAMLYTVHKVRCANCLVCLHKESVHSL